MEVISFFLSGQFPNYKRHNSQQCMKLTVVASQQSQQWVESTMGGVNNGWSQQWVESKVVEKSKALTFSQSILQSWVVNIFFSMEEGGGGRGGERERERGKGRGEGEGEGRGRGERERGKGRGIEQRSLKKKLELYCPLSHIRSLVKDLLVATLVMALNWCALDEG